MLVFLIILLGVTAYVVPGLIALARRHPGWKRVWLVNIFLGFTVLGWLWALRDALRRDAVHNHKVFYRYSYYGEETRRKKFDLRQLPGAGDVGLAFGALAVVAFLGTLAWPYLAPQPVTAVAAAATVSAQGWTYTQENDTSGPVHIATLISDDAEANGDRIPGALILRNGPGGLSAAIRVDGQFTCSAAAGGTVAVQFDNGPIETLACARRPDDVPRLDAGGQDMVFVAAPETFIARARASHSMVLMANLLDQGMRNVHFSPQGLDIAQAGLPEDTAVAAEAAKPAAVVAPAAPVAAKATPIADIQPVRHSKRPRAARPAKATHPAHKAARRKAEPDKRTVLHAFRPKSWKADGK